MRDAAFPTTDYSLQPLTRDPRSELARLSTSCGSAAGNPDRPQNFESLVISRNGGVLIVGWIDDKGAPVDKIKVTGSRWSLTFDQAALARVRRIDVEETLKIHAGYCHGYFGFIDAGGHIDTSRPCTIEVYAESRLSTTYESAPQLLEDADLRDLVLSYLATVRHLGHRQASAIACVDGGLGAEMIGFNRGVVRKAMSSPYVERFGSRRRSLRGSIAVSLSGGLDPIFVQNALLSSGRGIDDYEFIYVCHTPELGEQVLAEARVAARLYGLDQTVAILAGNAGFGGGANMAAGLAQTGRILAMSSDVFPRDSNWAEKHTRILEECPRDQTRLFGVPLFFDNGSLAGAGLYYDIDRGPILRGGEISEFYLGRVEHLGKGAPSDAVRFLTPRPVPGIARAFMSCDRGWFERLDGFDDAYVQGDYEDADLCLRSIEAGAPPWIQDLKFWHLEVQGTHRSSAYEGGSMINQWSFSARWGKIISETLSGQAPRHPALCPPSPPLAARPDAVRGLASDPRGDIADMVA